VTVDVSLPVEEASATTYGFGSASTSYGLPARHAGIRARPSGSLNIGASITVAVPTGRDDSQRIVNLGSNRWAF
jgi:hypothetical protein